MSFRTVWANQVDLSLAGSEVTIAGWVQRRRDHGGLIFVDIRDRSGIVQVVVEPQSPVFSFLDSLRAEYVVSISGTVQKRPEGMVNHEIGSGEVEIVPTQVKVLSQSKTPPFMPQEAESVDELVRLKYRYVDLRRPGLFNNFVAAHKKPLVALGLAPKNLGLPRGWNGPMPVFPLPKIPAREKTFAENRSLCPATQSY